MPAGAEAGPADASEISFDAGASADTPLDELNETQAIRVCEHARTLRARAIEQASTPQIMCMYTALMTPGVVDGATIDREACERALQACVDGMAETHPYVAPSNCSGENALALTRTCSVSLGTLSSCLMQLWAEASATWARFNCAALSQSDDAGSATPGAGVPDSSGPCSIVFEQCPDLQSAVGSLLAAP